MHRAIGRFAQLMGLLFSIVFLGVYLTNFLPVEPLAQVRIEWAAIGFGNFHLLMFGGIGLALFMVGLVIFAFLDGRF